MKLNLQRKGLLVVFVMLTMQLILIAVLWSLFERTDAENIKFTNAREAINQANNFDECLSKIELALQQEKNRLDTLNTGDNAGDNAGNTSGNSGDDSGNTFAPKTGQGPPLNLTELASELAIASSKLALAVSATPQYKASMGTIEEKTKSFIVDLRELGDAPKASVELQHVRITHFGERAKGLLDNLRSEKEKLVSKETESKDKARTAEKKYRAEVNKQLAFGYVANIIFAVWLGIQVRSILVSRMEVLTENAKRFARGEALLPRIGGSDEVENLDSLFHVVAKLLKEARAKELALLENLEGDVVCLLNGDGIFVHLYRSVKSGWGYDPAALEGQSLASILVEDDRENVSHQLANIKATKQAGKFECRIKTTTGTIATSWSAQWSEVDLSFLCISHDYTVRNLEAEEAKRQEQYIHTILNNMRASIATTTADGIIEVTNSSTETVFGVSESDLSGRHLVKLFADSKLYSEDKAEDRKAFMQIVLQAGLNHLGELDGKRSNGEVFPMYLQVGRLTDAAGEDGYLVSMLDTSQTRQEERMRKEFVSTVSHELRTPLTAIRGSLTLLSSGGLGALTEPVKKQIVVAERNVVRLIGLINDILDIEKMESGNLDMLFEKVNMSSILERAQEAVNSFADQHGVALDVQRCDFEIVADGDRIIQVLVNLMSNACKFSPKGAAVTVAVHQTPDGLLEANVIDRGRGIPEKFKKLLFQRFQQVEAADATKKGGTGLGLAICKGIIEAHNGTIGVESEEGHGSNFWFRIPCTRDSTPVS